MKNKIVMNLQLFAGSKSGVYPCYENQFQIDTAASGGTASLKNIADCVTFSVSFDNGVEEWNPFDTEGWTRRLMTSKSITISVTAKRNVGDAGNDFVAGLAWKNGRNADFPGWYCCEVYKISYQCEECWIRRFHSCSTS